MKALILAAGHGSRLRPLTNSIPKCLVEIDGKPLLQRWLEALESIGCELAIVNTHYLSTMVEDFLKDWKSDVLKVETKYEQKLLGGSRTLLQCRSEIEGDITLLIHADNMMEESLDGLVQAFNNRPNSCPITMLTFYTDYKEECGIVEIDSNGVVVNFHEKKKDAPGNLANGAVYALDRRVFQDLDDLPINELTDFTIDILSRMKGRINTYMTNMFFIDVGTQQRLEQARSYVKKQSLGEHTNV